MSDWTHPGLLTGSPVVADTVAANKFANYTLTNVFLGSTDGMSLGLSGITIANLVGALPGTAFTVSGWTGSGSLISGAAGISKAQGVVTASKDAGYTLTDGSLSSTDGMSLRLKGITTANLAATTVGNTFTVGGWTGTGVLTGGGGNGTTGAASGNVTASKDAGFTLANASLSSTDGMTLVMKGITSADLVDTGPGGNLFTVSGWTHAGSLTGVSDSLTAVESSNVTLSNSQMKAGTTSFVLTGITTANLTVTATTGHPAYILDASDFSAGPANLTASGTVNAIIFGGTGGHDTLTVAAGETGKNILIGNGAFDTLTDNGSGRNILIGAGSGGDTITGDGNDILVSGATIYDSDTGAHIAALDAILDEWNSTQKYAVRITRIMNGLTPELFALNSSTITPDTIANTLSDGTGQSVNANWFIASSQDTVTENGGETDTII